MVCNIIKYTVPYHSQASEHFISEKVFAAKYIHGFFLCANSIEVRAPQKVNAK